MAVDLGDVTFGLVPNTSALQSSMALLHRYGLAASNAARSTAQGSAQVVAAYARQERAVRSALQQLLSFQAQVRRTQGADPQLLAQTTRAYQSLARQLTNGTVNVLQFNRAQDLFEARLNRARIALGDFKAGMHSATQGGNKLSAVIRQLESASVLAVGPLSGIGSRIRALGAITSRSTLAIAGFFAGITAGAVAIGKLVSGAISAARAYEQLNATLRVASGSQSLANVEFAFVTEQTRRLGLDLQETARLYGHLAAASRDTALAGEQTREIFLGISEAAAALSLPTQQVQRAFAAITQIISKGNVQQEELRGQLAEAIPGALRLAAKAMDVTTEALNEMIKKGEVTAEELLPKLAAELRKTFGDEAERNAGRLTGATNNLATSFFLFNLAVDQAAGFSRAYIGVLQGLTSALDFLTNNMDMVVASLGALTGAMLGAFGPMIFRGVLLLATYIRGVTFAVLGLTAATTALQAVSLVGLVAMIARLGLVLAGAAAGFATLSNSMSVNSVMSQQLIADASAYIESQRAVGFAMEETSRKYIDEIKKRIEALKIEMKAVLAQAKAIETIVPTRGGGYAISQLAEQRKREMETAAADIVQVIAELSGQLHALETMPTKSFSDLATGAGEASDEFENLRDKLAEMVSEYRTFASAIDAQDGGQTAVQYMLDLGEAQRMLADVPVQEQAALSQMLSEQGINAATLADQIAILTTRHRDMGAAVDDLQERMKATDEAMKSYNETIAELNGQIRAMNAGPEAFEHFQHMESTNAQVQKMRETLEATSLKQAEINQLLNEYRSKITAYDEAKDKMERLKEVGDTITNSLKRGFDVIGDTITEAFVKGKADAIDFGNIMQGVLSEIYRSLIQIMLIKPLTEGFSSILTSVIGSFVGGIGGGSNAVSGTPAAKGLAMAGGKIQMLARGGVINSPMFFPAGGGGAMGSEYHQAEAIMPLARASNGGLGVNVSGATTVNVNVINKTDSQTTVSRRQSGSNIDIDVMISKAAAKNLRSGGAMFSAIQDMFEVKPRYGGR